MNKTPDVPKKSLPASVKDKVQAGIPLRKAVAMSGNKPRTVKVK